MRDNKRQSMLKDYSINCFINVMIFAIVSTRIDSSKVGSHSVVGGYILQFQGGPGCMLRFCQPDILLDFDYDSSHLYKMVVFMLFPCTFFNSVL